MAIQKNSIRTTLSNLFKKGYFPVILDKIKTRLKEPSVAIQKKEALAWCQSVGEPQETYCTRLDADLYQKSIAYNEWLVKETKSRLAELPVKMGGPGDITLAHFLTWYYKPETIVETGVSMGFTSYTFLQAIAEGAGGKLYSSDFPYFRIDNPEKYIGWVVPDKLRENWNLLIEGDQVNIPQIIKEVDQIDLFHYDSDKSIIGRKRAWEQVLPKLAANVVIVFDDIDDNLHFKTEIFEVFENVKVLESRLGGYVGILHGLNKKG